MPDHAWIGERLPPETVGAVRQGIAPLVDEVIATIRAENPVYADVLAAPEGIGIRLGIERAVEAFLDAAQQGTPPGGETGEVWRRLGEAEFQAGRSLDALRAAFRTGTRAAWRGAARIAARAGIDAELVIVLAEAIFLYSDELAADVVEGYLRIQSDEAGEIARRRRRLASLLADRDGPDPEAITHAAELARWTPPRTLAVAALASDAPAEVVRGLDPDTLAGADGEGSFLIVPDPEGPGRAAALDRALRGLPAALGPAVEPARTRRSLDWARVALELVNRGRLSGPGAIRVQEHLTAVMLLRDEELARTLIARRLAPLDALPAAERERLLGTLAAWLAHQRHTPGIAAELHVHPQTVRYRIGKLRELLGGTLESADGRFELELALRARAMLGAG